MKVDWGITPSSLNQNPMRGRRGTPPQIYLSVLYGEKECVIAVLLRETAIMRDFLQNPPSWRASFGSNPPLSLAENLTVFGR